MLKEDLFQDLSYKTYSFKKWEKIKIHLLDGTNRDGKTYKIAMTEL